MGASCGDVGKGTLASRTVCWARSDEKEEAAVPGGVLPGRRGMRKNMINHAVILFTLERFLRGSAP